MEETDFLEFSKIKLLTSIIRFVFIYHVFRDLFLKNKNNELSV